MVSGEEDLEKDPKGRSTHDANEKEGGGDHEKSVGGKGFDANEKDGGGDHEKSVGGKGLVVSVDSSQTTVVSRIQAMRPVQPIEVVTHSGATPLNPAIAVDSTYQTPPHQATQGASLNSRVYTNRISLFIFLLHLLAESTALGFFIFKAVQGALEEGTPRARKERRVLQFWLPPIEGAAVLSAVLAFAWQRAVRWWPSFMIRFILFGSPLATLSAGILLLCFSMPGTDGVGIALVLFSIGSSLYACWAGRRLSFTARVFHCALQPAARFPDLERPAYLMLGVGFIWISVWSLAVIGALNFYYPPLTIIALVLSLAWTTEEILA